MRAPTRAAWLVAALTLGSCALVPKLQTPKLSVVSVQVVSGDLWTQHLKVRVHVENPNDRALPVKGLEYTLEVDGEELASGTSASAFVVPPLGEAEFDTEVTTNLAGPLLKVLGHSSQALEQGVPYRLSGKVALSEGLWRSIHFDEHGTFKLQ